MSCCIQDASLLFESLPSVLYSPLLSVQSQFENSSYLEIGFQQAILSPGAVMEVPVNFYPRETCRYHEKLTFILNSCVTKQVDILGQGIEMKVRKKSV